MATVDFARYLDQIERATPVTVKGRVKEVVGLLVRASVPEARVGELCLIYTGRSNVPLKAEVVGFSGGDVLLMPLGDVMQVGPSSEVVPTGNCLTVPVGDGLLGRALDGLGDPMDVEVKGPLPCTEFYPV